MPDHNEATLLPILEETNPIYLEQPQTEPLPRPVDPDNPSWGVGSALLLWIASLLLVVFVPLIFLIPYASYRGIEFNPSSPDYWPAVVQFAISDKTAVLLQVTALLPIHILTFFLVWALVTRSGKQPFKAAIGWGWPRNLPPWLGMTLCVVLGVVMFGVGNVIAKLLGADTPTQLEQIIKSSYAARFALAFLAVATAPFVEEFVYRGVLYSAFRRGVGTLCAWVLALFSVRLQPAARERIGVVGAVIFVLALFTMIHVPQYWPNIGVIAAVGILSFVLTVVRAYTGRLLPCIVIHLVFNGITAVILLVEPYLQRFLPPGTKPVDAASILLPLIGIIN